ncbi:MAG: hypothetical protein K9M54_09420 [Kiritimatiellales bacterium]|nr:hypothetical protein [Kiritimatiellales bacterium]MCF7863423.1 hypothetical protein [Kiritimatiellales bacterium]
MKVRNIVVSSLIVLLIAVAANAEMREFKLPDGRSLNAEITGYNGNLDQVELKREDGKCVSVKPDIFVEADQAYIKAWAMLEGVRSASSFKISCDRRVAESWTKERFGTIHYTGGAKEENQVVGKTSFEKILYQVTLENRNSYAVGGLFLEYCIYYEQELKTSEAATQGVLHGSIKVDKVPAQGKAEFDTNPAVIFKDESNSEFTNSRVLKGKVLGVLLRLYMDEKGGKTLLRELALPSGLAKSCVWTEQSSPIKEK